MGRGNASNVVTIRILSDNEMDSLLASIGTMLMVEGFSPEVHTRRLLTYQMEIRKKRGIRKPILRVVKVFVQVTDLPIGFTVEEGSHVDIPIAHAFGISAPRPILSVIENIVAPFIVDMEKVKAHSGEFLSGMTFDKRIPGISCDHCGHVQEVTIPIQISRVEGDMGYGPGGSATVLCSNPDCNKTFDVNWDSIRVEVSFI